MTDKKYKKINIIYNEQLTKDEHEKVSLMTGFDSLYEFKLTEESKLNAVGIHQLLDNFGKLPVPMANEEHLLQVFVAGKLNFDFDSLLVDESTPVSGDEKISEFTVNMGNGETSSFKIRMPNLGDNEFSELKIIIGSDIDLDLQKVERSLSEVIELSPFQDSPDFSSRSITSNMGINLYHFMFFEYKNDTFRLHKNYKFDPKNGV